MAKKKERAPFQASFRGPDGAVYALRVEFDKMRLAVIDREGTTLYKVVEEKPEKEPEKEPEKTKKEGK